MSESSSKISWNVMPENEKLFWKDGQTNLLDWFESVYKYARLHFEEDIIEAIVNLTVPPEWEQEWVDPTPTERAGYDSYMISLKLKLRDDHIKNGLRWKNCRAKLTSFVTLSQLESSRLRVDKHNERQMKDLVSKSDIIEILKVIRSSHTFSGVVSGFEDQERTNLEWVSFKLHDGEALETYSNRYHKLLKKCTNVGIKINNKRKVVYRYLNGLRHYTKSKLVNLSVLTYISLVDDLKKFPRDYGFIVEELQKLEQSENPVESKATNSNKFAVDSTESKGKNKGEKALPAGVSEYVFPNGEKGIYHSDGNYQVHSVKGLSKKFKSNSESYSGLFKPSHVQNPKTQIRGDKKRKVTFNNNSNNQERTKEYAKKLKGMDEHKSKSWKEIYQLIKCYNCNEHGHLSYNCTKQSNGDSNAKSVTSIDAGASAIQVPGKLEHTSSFFSLFMVSWSKPITEEEIYKENLIEEKRVHYCNIDGHANIHLWNNEEELSNVREVDPITVEFGGGFTKKMNRVGDHPLLGVVYIDKNNKHNIISVDIMREQQGYYRQVSEDNMKEYLINKEMGSILTFERDPMDGFYKMLIVDLNREALRIFPKMCQAIT